MNEDKCMLGDLRIVRVESNQPYPKGSAHYEVEQYSQHWLFWRKWKALDGCGGKPPMSGSLPKKFLDLQDAYDFACSLKQPKRNTRKVVMEDV